MNLAQRFINILSRWMAMLVILTIYSGQLSGQVVCDSKIIELDQGLKFRIVNNIQRDAYGHFYIMSDNFLQRWDGANFTDIDISELEDKSIFESPSKLVELKDSTIILLSTKAGSPLYKIDIAKLRLKKLRPRSLDQNIKVINSSGVLYEIRHHSDQVEIITLNSQLDSLKSVRIPTVDEIEAIALEPERLIFETYKGHIKSYIFASSSLIDHELQGHLLSNCNGSSIVATNEALYRREEDGYIAFHKINKQGFYFTFGDYDKVGNIMVGHTDSERHIREINVVKPDHSIIHLNKILPKPKTAPKTSETEDDKTKNDRIKDIYADNYEDKLLLGTYNGIYYHSLLTDEIKQIEKRNKSVKSQFGLIISGICHDENGNVYFVSESHGLYKYDVANDTAYNILKPHQKEFFTGNLKLYYDEKTRTIWSDSYNNNFTSDLYTYNLDSGIAKKIPLQALLNDFINLDDDHFLMAGRENIKLANNKIKTIPKIIKFNKKTRETTSLDVLDPDKYTRARFLQEYKDYMFIGTSDGLVVTDRSMTNIVTTIDKNININGITLASDWMVFVKPYHKYLLVGTHGEGLLVLDEKTLKPIKKLNTDNGLLDNTAVSMEIDALGNAWVTSFNGIHVIDTSLTLIEVIMEYEGLSDREFSSTANVALDGKFYFGTNNGMTVIDPIKLLNKKPSNGLYINSIEIVQPEGQGILRYDYSDPNITIQNGVDSIFFNITSPDYYIYNFTTPLDGISAVSNNGSKINISHGKLVLKNIALNETEVKIYSNMNDQISTVNIFNKRNYLKYWKSILAVLSTILISYFISKYMIQKNKEREAEKTKYNKKIAELRLNALKSQMNPHFIFNSLGAIQYFIQTQETSKADEYLSKFAKLMRLILESSKNEYVSIKDEMQLMELYSDLEYVRFEGLFDYIVDIDEEVDTELEIPPMIVQPLVENAINHGLYNLKVRKGLLEILTRYISDDEIQIIVRDNGVGRSFSSEPKKQKHISRGMEILKERVSIINEKGEMKVTCQINDLKDGDKNTGTEVLIDIKYLH